MHAEYEELQQVKELCLGEQSKNPITVLQHLVALPFVPVNGPVHHILVGAALLTAYKNAGGDLDLPAALDEIIERGNQVPGRVCGLWGACGSGISSGMFVSIVTKSSPLAEGPLGLSNLMTSKSLAKIGEIGGPRCCKRDGYLSILEAVDFAEEHLGVKMEKPDISEIVCAYKDLNKQCIGECCPFA